MTETLSAALEHEHRLIDEGVEGCATAVPAQQQLAALGRAVVLLRRHIYLEEEHLFPPLREAGLVGPVMVMLHEHGLMWQTLDQLDELTTTGATDKTSAICRNLLGQLATHNMKEEGILYPQADRLLPAGDLAELTELMRCAQLPTGWVCEGARQGV